MADTRHSKPTSCAPPAFDIATAYFDESKGRVGRRPSGLLAPRRQCSSLYRAFRAKNELKSMCRRSGEGQPTEYRVAPIRMSRYSRRDSGDHAKRSHARKGHSITFLLTYILDTT
jgi:hypothetical protein